MSLVYAHQALPLLRQSESTEGLSRRGAYVLLEAEGGPRAVTLLASGFEVAVAMSARQTLQREGVPTAVVSAPCCETFDRQDQDCRDRVLGVGTVRVAVEAAVLAKAKGHCTTGMLHAPAEDTA